MRTSMWILETEDPSYTVSDGLPFQQKDGEDERTYKYNHISTFYYLQYDFILKYYNKLLSPQGA